MNKGMLGIGIILMGIIALLMVNIISNFSSGGELDYYLLKETSDASMIDALDKDFYTNYGLYRIDKEKYAESFIRRFAQGVDGTRSYQVDIIDVNELPQFHSQAILLKHEVSGMEILHLCITKE